MQRTSAHFSRPIVTAALLVAVLLLAVLWPTRSPAVAQTPVTPWLPMFVCPDRITLWDDIEQIVEIGEPNFDVISVPEWTLFFQSADQLEYGTQTGSGPIVFDDRNGLREDMDYNYLVRYQVEARNKTTDEITSWQANLVYNRHTWPYCSGQIHSNYVFNERHYYFISFDVWDGYSLTIPGGTTLEQYQPGGEVHLGNPGNDLLVEGKLISATLVVGGNDAVLDGAHVSGGGARVFDGGTLRMKSGTVGQSKFTVFTGTVVLDRVSGSVVVEQWPGAQVWIQNSTLQADLAVKSSASLNVWNSTLTGSVRAFPGGSTNNPLSQATLISVTLLAPDNCRAALVTSERDAVVTLNRYRIDTRGLANCYAVETYGGQMQLWNGTIDGQISAHGDSILDAYRLDMTGTDGRAGHDLRVSSGARVSIAASRLRSLNQLYIWPGGKVTITDSSLISTTIFVDGDLAGTSLTLLCSDLSLVERWYMLWVQRVASKMLRVNGNCLYSQLALNASGSDVLHFEENYWNHALGPNFPPANVNPDGAGISVSGSSTILFEPFLNVEPGYCRQWPRSAPHTAQGLVGPAGGILAAPGAMLVFPPGAVAQDAAVTWEQGEETAQGVQAAGPEAAALLGRFQLTAARAAAPSQPLGFQRPVSLTLYYDGMLPASVDDKSLVLCRWDRANWVPLAGTEVLVSTDSLQALLPEPAVYGLFGAARHSLYLPLCRKEDKGS